MDNFSTIGIVGGMGPEATNRLAALITALTPARRDQDHIPVIIFNNPGIPDRVSGIRRSGVSPLPEIIRTAQVLEQAGAAFLLMPCNLAHVYIAEVQKAIHIPLLNMIEETVKFTIENYPQCRKVGLVASTPTIESGIYEKAFLKKSVILISPDRDEQETKVMRAIYGKDGIKGGHKTKPRVLLKEVARHLTEKGAEVVVAGCTEASLVMMPNNSCVVIDPLTIMAGVAVKRAMATSDSHARHANQSS